MYKEIMLRNKSIFQISTLVLSSISISNLLIDLPTYYTTCINDHDCNLAGTLGSFMLGSTSGTNPVENLLGWVVLP
jgi:hypothetical protein